MNDLRFYRTTRNFFAAVAMFFVTVCLFIGIFCWYGRAYVRIPFENKYYLLVKDCEEATVTAVMGEVYASGGAAYLYGTNAVALACYFTQTDAERVQHTLSERNVETRIVPLVGKDLYLYGDRAELSERVEANLSTVHACAQLLYDTANGLERMSYSQEEARARLEGVTSVLLGLQKENRDAAFSRWNADLFEIEQTGRDFAGGILFSKDMRNLQVRLCIMISEAAEYFT